MPAHPDLYRFRKSISRFIIKSIPRGLGCSPSIRYIPRSVAAGEEPCRNTFLHLPFSPPAPSVQPINRHDVCKLPGTCKTGRYLIPGLPGRQASYPVSQARRIGSPIQERPLQNFDKIHIVQLFIQELL